MRTSGKVLKDFENLRKALFDEEISHMAFMRDGKVEILYTQKYVDKLEDQLQQKESIIKEVREYITSYESIETMQQFDHNKNNKDLDYSTMDEMTRRYMIVHDKVLEILDKVEE